MGFFSRVCFDMFSKMCSLNESLIAGFIGTLIRFAGMYSAMLEKTYVCRESLIAVFERTLICLSFGMGFHMLNKIMVTIKISLAVRLKTL